MWPDQHRVLIKGIYCATCSNVATKKCYTCGKFVCNDHECGKICYKSRAIVKEEKEK